MTPVAFLVDAPDITLAGEAPATSWVQVAKTGKFTDPRYGNFSITKQDFARWIKNFNDISLADGHLGLPVDLDHSPEKRGDTEAVGWVKQLETRGEKGDELWGRVEWNPKGKELVAERSYAYISPSYSNNLKTENGTAVGTALVGIALTNRPFLNMATINLSKAEEGEFQFAKNDPDNDGDSDGLTQPDIDLDWPDGDADETTSAADHLRDIAPHILDVSDQARKKYAVVSKTIGGKTKHMFPIPPGDKLHARLAKAFVGAAQRAGHITSQEAAEIRSRADEVLGSGKDSKQHGAYSHRQMELSKVLTALNVTLSDLGLDESADEATVLAKLSERKATPPAPAPAPTGDSVTLSADQIATLMADAAAGRAAAQELHLSKFENAFSLAQSEGKVVLAQKDTFKAIYDQNAELALKTLSELKPVVNMTPIGTGQEPVDLGETARELAGEFQDVVTPYGIDTDALRIHSAAVALEKARGISYEQALTLAEQGVTV